MAFIVMVIITMSSGFSRQRYHFRAILELVQVIRPLLHHLAALRQVLGKVVCRADLVAFAVYKLPLDHLMRISPERVAVYSGIFVTDFFQLLTLCLHRLYLVIRCGLVKNAVSLMDGARNRNRTGTLVLS